MTHDQAKRLFRKAVECLVDEGGPVKERLLIAYATQLSRIAPSELPPKMVSGFDGFQVKLGQDEVVGDRGNAAAEIAKMSDAEASDIARAVFAMFCDLHDIE